MSLYSQPAPVSADVSSAAHEFFLVARLIPRLIPDHQRITTIFPHTTVREALEIMNDHGYSQLPVIAGSTVIGVFSYRSFSRGIQNIRRQDDPLDSYVEDFIEDVAFVRASDDVSVVLVHFDRDGVVLIGDEDNLLGVATAADAIGFFWQAARPFVLLQDIELAVRELMRKSCTSDELERRIASVGRSTDELRPDVSELTLGEMINVLVNGENFGQCFHSTFGENRRLVISQLEPVREIRNQVLHFRDEASIDQIERVRLLWRDAPTRVTSAA